MPIKGRGELVTAFVTVELLTEPPAPTFGCSWFLYMRGMPRAQLPPQVEKTGLSRKDLVAEMVSAVKCAGEHSQNVELAVSKRGGVVPTPVSRELVQKMLSGEITPDELTL